ncbi:PepSY domain-containing protein [Phytomonospora sp. NPDC050363]|uniref:PepSY domain-containing protein n=1 Tax=Phytomonospora sp. NPDC050363 TaxID=3155642 RepID=UPI0033EC5B5A
MYPQSRLQLRRLATVLALAVPLLGAISTSSDAARASPDPRHLPPAVAEDEAAAIAVARLPHCSVLRAELYYDGHAPMWFVETKCSDETWQDLRIDALTGRVIAINGDYDV